MLPLESLDAAQAAIDGWAHAYNHQRPHQALEMAVPASRFRLPRSAAVEFEARLAPSGHLTVVSGRQGVVL